MNSYYYLHKTDRPSQTRFQNMVETYTCIPKNEINEPKMFIQLNVFPIPDSHAAW